MENQVKALHEIIKDYRIDEEGYGVSEARIRNWVNQFPEDDRLFVLEELILIFEKMYFSEDRAKSFLIGIIKKLQEDFGYASPEELLNNSNFLDLQAEGKSQKKLLELLYGILREELNYNPDNLGSDSKTHNIYIDDVLCTGNTFFNNMKNWILEEGGDRLTKLRSNEIDLTIFYILISKKHYDKKQGQFYYQVREDSKNLYNAFAIHWFQDEILKPIDNDLPGLVTEYKDKVEDDANRYAELRGYNAYPSDFFRNEVTPEEFYSSPENRKRLEMVFLKKGIEILNCSNVTMNNIRPLGYSLPAYKDFGLGILFFSWRNVPNNSPLVFWYRGAGFTPLFVNRR